MGQCNADADI